MLVVFATPHENPFPVHLEKGKECRYADMLLLLAGVGKRSAERLELALDRNGTVTKVVEYGGAAAVSGAEIGALYTVRCLFNRAGIVEGSLPTVPGLAPAAAVCAESLYRGEGFSWGAAMGLPLLYTMETAFLYGVCRRCQIPFSSIRLATDDGQGDTPRQYRQVLGEHREQAANILLSFSEVFHL